MKTKAIQLVETKKGFAFCGSKPGYDVVLHGAKWGELYFNIIGYVGTLPLPNGDKLYMTEGSIASFKKEIAKLNQEWAETVSNPTLSTEYEREAQQQKNFDDGFRQLQRGG